LPREDYIRTFMTNREQILAYLNEYLDAKRVKHSLGVEKTAAKLARRFGEDEGKAALAGLAHDCAKSRRYTPQQMKELAAASRFYLTDDEIRQSPHILHAPAGETVARRVLGITDDAVLGAICWHTVPREDMSVLEKIVSLADMIEPNRRFAGVRSLREAAQRDLDEAFMLSLKHTMAHLLEHDLAVHPLTLRAYNRQVTQKPRQNSKETDNG
ncbi:MAG: bis(5'-nucleosyl)-tetraphosphatase (symmetrical) YqeK, partial [Eubacteriales bacterium]|nr:bis(5'-nucleosyl)-tetraphosphatase (symmetrical) YqeK [Eubacteriales bacterium]